MNVEPIEIMMKQYRCGVCKRLHGSSDYAISCCRCEVCEKAQATEVKGTKYDWSKPDHCAKCLRTVKRRELRSEQARAKRELEEAQESVAHWTKRVSEIETELASL